MKTAAGISKREYARRYDEYADKLWYFALQVSGDELSARRLMAELFVKGYFCCSEENFLFDMAASLWRIMESCAPKAVCETPGGLPLLHGFDTAERAAVLLKALFSMSDAEISDILDISQSDIADIHARLVKRMKTMAG